MAEDWHGSESPLELGELFLAGICPIPRHILVHEMSKRDCHVKKVDNEWLVHACEDSGKTEHT